MKTPSVNSDTIKITSLSQLSSDKNGRLAIVQVEKMSNEYEEEETTILSLVEKINNEIKSLELKQQFLTKLSEYGFSEENNFVNYKFSVHNISIYEVREEFPRLNEADIKFQEIGNVQYELFINTLERYKVEEL